MASASQGTGYHRPDDMPLFAKRTEQQKQIDRVSTNIASTVLDFCSSRIAAGRHIFAVVELHEFVQSRHPGAPGSPDRILRLLRRQKKVAYTVVNRSASLYQLVQP